MSLAKLAHIPEAPIQADSLPLGPANPWLAPLAGYSDLPFRLLCREYGAACCVTEMVSAKGLHFAGNNTWQLLVNTPADTPTVVQLFGAEAPILAGAVRELRQWGYQWFDLNMGCSVPKVAKQGAGSAMLRDPDNAVACVKAMVDAALPGHVTAKLRLGLTEATRNWLEVALRLQDAGVGLLTLHPRTAREGFGGHARWEELARAKRELAVPVIASGDLFTAEDGLRCLGETGVDGVMYARGALTNPAIFARHHALLRGEPGGAITAGELKRMIRRHIALIVQTSDSDSALFRLRSIVPRYVRQLPGVRVLRQRLVACRDLDELDAILDECLRSLPDNAPAAGLADSSAF